VIGNTQNQRPVGRRTNNSWLFQRLLLLSSLILFKGVSANPHDDDGLYAIGKAVDQVTGELLYIEQYSRDSSNTETVTYLNEDQSLLAIKTLNWAYTDWSPAVSLRYAESGGWYQVSVTSRVTGLFQKAASRRVKNFQTEVLHPMVVDAGFNPFVTDHWDQLASGETIDFFFYAPTKGRFFALKLMQKRQQSEGAEWVHFIIEPENWLLKGIVKPIKLQYNQQRQLIQFNGRSNITDHQGSYLDVIINYRYTDLDYES